MLDHLKQAPDWCNCAEYPRSAHCHFSDGTHGAPFISVAALRHRMDEISGFVKGHKAETGVDAKEEYETLNQQWRAIAGENVRAAHMFYDDPLFKLGHYSA